MDKDEVDEPKTGKSKRYGSLLSMHGLAGMVRCKF